MSREYFSHDYGTRNKKKMAALIQETGSRGYGLFWIIVEMLHEDSTKWMDMDEITFLAIQKESCEEVEYIREFILRGWKVFKIFVEENGKFTTERTLRNIEKREQISEKRSGAGKKSAELRASKSITKKQKSTSVEQTATTDQQNSTKERKLKEIKGKENKERESTGRAHDLSGSNLYRTPTIPTLEQVQAVFLRQGGTMEMAEKFFAKYEATKWYLNNSPIKAFSALVPGYILNWNSREGNSSNPEKTMVY